LKDHFPKIIELLPKVKAKMTGPLGDSYARSYVELKNPDAGGYSRDLSKKITDQNWISHFKQKPDIYHGRQYGAFALHGIYIGDRGRFVKFIAIDSDTAEQTARIYDYVIPVLTKRNVPYLLELGGDQLERRKVWIFTGECLFDVAYQFIETILAEAGLSTKDFDGVYPTHVKTVIRIPGGFYPKRARTFPLEVGGKEIYDAPGVMQAIIDCPIFSEEQMQAYLKGTKVTIPKRLNTKKLRDLPENFRWIPLNLPLPKEDLPESAQFLCSNCPSYNKLITDTIHNKFIDNPGGMHHDAGVCLSALGQFVDKKTKSRAGEDWFDDMVDWYRSRDPQSHAWKHGWGKHAGIWRCETMEEKFDWCQGCQHRGAIDSPRQLMQKAPLEKEKIGDIFFTTPDWIQQNTFPHVRRYIHRVLANKGRDNILLASPQGSGKSFSIDHMMANLAKLGYTSLLAVPTAELAMEHKNRLKDEWGVDAFVCMSFEKLMDHVAKIPCPNYDGILAQQKLGMASYKSKQEYCKGCKFKDQCPFPKQYKNAQDAEKRVVIIQHAHFSCQETVFQLLNNKKFDILFVDESFIGSVFTDIKPTAAEKAVLETCGYLWTDALLEWFKYGGYPDKGSKVDPDEVEREIVDTKFSAAGIPSRVAQFIRLYQQNKWYDLETGVFDFHPVPEIPVRVFTDATPPQEMIEAVLDEPLTVFGEGEVIDYRTFHPDNRVIQVIDGSMSKTALAKDDYTLLIDMMSYLGRIGRKEFPTEKILVTVYEDQKKIAETWLKQNYPDVHARCTFGLMSVGTNAYADYDVQMILAGVHLDGKRIPTEAYRIKSIMNYWNRRKGRREINNIFPAESDKYGIDKTWEEVTKIHPDGLFKYNVLAPVPKRRFERMVHNLDRGRTQQAIRIIRPYTGKSKSTRKKTVIIAGNMSLPSYMITEVRLLRTFLPQD
jgi:hypothetical protein